MCCSWQRWDRVDHEADRVCDCAINMGRFVSIEVRLCHLMLLRSCGALSDPCSSSSRRIWEPKASPDFSMPVVLFVFFSQLWMAPVWVSLWGEVLVGRYRCVLSVWSYWHFIRSVRNNETPLPNLNLPWKWRLWLLLCVSWTVWLL